VFEEGVGGPVGAGGSCDNISVLSSERDFPRVGMKTSISKGTFLRRVVYDMKIIFDLEIYPLLSALTLHISSNIDHFGHVISTKI